MPGVEECFDWLKRVGGLCNGRFVARGRPGSPSVLTTAASNPIRMRNLGMVWC